jgi:hypothetical protein
LYEEAVNPESAKDFVRYHVVDRPGRPTSLPAKSAGDPVETAEID